MAKTKDKYYEDLNKKGIKTIQAALNLVRKGLLTVLSARMDKEYLDGGYRLTVYFREKK